MLQLETEDIDTRPYQPAWTKAACTARPDHTNNLRAGPELAFGPKPEIWPHAKPVDAPYVFRVAENSTCRSAGAFDSASALGEQHRHPAGRSMSLGRGATFLSSARPRCAYPKPRYALLSRSTIWINPLCDGLGHLSVATIGVQPRRCVEPPDNSTSSPNENHRCNPVVRFCSQDG
jgi:hypothetical protein